VKLADIYRLFPTQNDCIKYLEKLRWNGTPICPYCNSDRTTRVEKGQRHHCNICNTPFRVTVYTTFHHTHLPLQKWFLAIWLTLNTRRGRSSKGLPARELAKELETNKNTAHLVSKRLKHAMEDTEQRELLLPIGDLQPSAEQMGGHQVKSAAINE
jgi:transposase-like protein